jgi:hypothetical protein
MVVGPARASRRFAAPQCRRGGAGIGLVATFLHSRVCAVALARAYASLVGQPYLRFPGRDGGTSGVPPVATLCSSLMSSSMADDTPTRVYAPSAATA